MKFKLIILITLSLGLISPKALIGQSALNLHLTAIAFHVSDKPNYLLYENSLDELGNIVVEPMAILTYQRFFKTTRNSFQISQGLYSDAAAQMAGFTYFSLKKKLIHSFKNVISISIGPSLSYRKDWHKINGYIEDNSFTVDGTWEYKWLFAAEINYYYYLAKRSDFSVSLHYGYEQRTIFLTVGYRFWINPLVHEKKCDCENAWNFKFKDIPRYFKRVFK